MGLEQVYKPARRLGQVQVVFIHGLGGHPRETWMADPKDPSTLWPRWIGEQTGCPVWVLGYNATASRWKADSLAVWNQGSAILEMLTTHSKLRGPLVLVCHSLGGLVVKAAVQRAAYSQAAYQHEFLENLKGVAFVGTPHFGSWLATAVGLLRLLLRPNPQMSDLKSANPNLEALNQAFGHHQRERGLKVIVYREMHGLRVPKILGGRLWPISVQVVSPTSANPQMQDAPIVDIDANHKTICKPQDENALIHQSLTAFIERVNAPFVAPGDRQEHPHPQASGGLVRGQSERELKAVHLAFAASGLTLEMHTVGPLAATAIIVSDAPEQLRQQLQELRRGIGQDPLSTEYARGVAQHATLAQLAADASTRAAFERAIATIHFSAYLYFAHADALQKKTSEMRRTMFFVEPLKQRLSKKGERVARVQSARTDADLLVKLAVEAVKSAYHRSVELPEAGPQRYTDLEQLAALVASSAAGHLGPPKNADQSAIFSSLRTRIRFAEDLGTGQRYLRDSEPPLP